jgi:hypothetical protein
MKAMHDTATGLAAGIARLEAFELVSDGSDIPVFAFKLEPAFADIWQMAGTGRFRPPFTHKKPRHKDGDFYQMVRAFAAIHSGQQAYSQKVLYSPTPGRIQEYGAAHSLHIDCPLVGSTKDNPRHKDRSPGASGQLQIFTVPHPSGKLKI